MTLIADGMICIINNAAPDQQENNNSPVYQKIINSVISRDC
jgi:hypothetical protein